MNYLKLKKIASYVGYGLVGVGAITVAVVEIANIFKPTIETIKETTKTIKETKKSSKDTLIKTYKEDNTKLYTEIASIKAENEKLKKKLRSDNQPVTENTVNLHYSHTPECSWSQELYNRTLDYDKTRDKLELLIRYALAWYDWDVCEMDYWAQLIADRDAATANPDSIPSVEELHDDVHAINPWSVRTYNLASYVHGKKAEHCSELADYANEIAKEDCKLAGIVLDETQAAQYPKYYDENDRN